MPLKLRAQYKDKDSLAFRLRKKRFAFFLSLLNSLDRPIRILDVGGTPRFWQVMDFTPDSHVELTIVNLVPLKVELPHTRSVVGDACQLQFEDGEFDVVFSNSVIEHVSTYDNQIRMAQEIKRVGKRYFVQTPNRYFPIEPHFFFPFFQFLPISTRVWLLTHIALGITVRTKLDRKTALERAAPIRLLSKRELILLFPEASLYTERFCGIAKSFTVYFGWE